MTTNLVSNHVLRLTVENVSAVKSTLVDRDARLIQDVETFFEIEEINEINPSEKICKKFQKSSLTKHRDNILSTCL